MSETGSVFKAVADDTRRDILRLLSTARRPVSELAERFPGISRPAVSKHLRILRQAGLVSESREGRRRLYRLRPEALEEIARWLVEVETKRAGGGLAGGARRAGALRPSRRPAGLRPLPRDEPDDPDWRSW